MTKKVVFQDTGRYMRLIYTPSCGHPGEWPLPGELICAECKKHIGSAKIAPADMVEIQFDEAPAFGAPLHVESSEIPNRAEHFPPGFLLQHPADEPIPEGWEKWPPHQHEAKEMVKDLENKSDLTHTHKRDGQNV